MSAPDDGLQALLLTGGLAAGKTSIAVEVGEALERADIPGAVIDLDWLCWAWSPRLSDAGVHDLLCRNLAATLPHFVAAGAKRLVLARGILDRAELSALHAALGDIPLTTVRLAVSPDMATARLRSRDTGDQLAEHLAELASFEARVREAAGDAAPVDTTGRSPAEVALEVVHLVGWL